jgi:hypothetical protein
MAGTGELASGGREGSIGRRGRRRRVGGTRGHAGAAGKAKPDARRHAERDDSTQSTRIRMPIVRSPRAWPWRGHVGLANRVPSVVHPSYSSPEVMYRSKLL